MLNLGAGELAALAVIALFVLGPERLPGAIRWVTQAANQIKSCVATAKEQLDAPEFDELREPLDELREPLAQLRAADPRRAVRDALRDSSTTTTAAARTARSAPPAGPPTTEHR